MKDRADLGVIFTGLHNTRVIQRDESRADKGRIELAGQKVCARVADRLGPQVEHLGVVSNEVPQWMDEIPEGTAHIVDDVMIGGRSAGPAGALVAALRAALAYGEDAVVLTAPIDSPFLPDDLYVRLAGAMYASGAGAAMVSTRGKLNPFFALWRAVLCEDVAHVVEHDRVRSVEEIAGMARAVEVMAWDDVTFPPPFFAINTEDEIRIAEDLAKLGN